MEESREGLEGYLNEGEHLRMPISTVQYPRPYTHLKAAGRAFILSYRLLNHTHHSIDDGASFDEGRYAGFMNWERMSKTRLKAEESE
ncbi:hypothetical protein M378DRAFT_171327 [Amanita muscaria Koide BX008]|uniref:Uncharacterized protein n=1 Tax=Amanita muscaria (strain Koide BX008) TaxID=946122 RepID=A0A0C2W9C6_AMAMK|nr:hypothetical protein M378DRAFT_171327 [Amanita muscaria Koide BX008]